MVGRSAIPSGFAMTHPMSKSYLTVAALIVTAELRKATRASGQPPMTFTIMVEETWSYVGGDIDLVRPGTQDERVEDGTVILWVDRY